MKPCVFALVVSLGALPLTAAEPRSVFLTDLDAWARKEATAEDVLRRLDGLFPPDGFVLLERRLALEARRAEEIRATVRAKAELQIRTEQEAEQARLMREAQEVPAARTPSKNLELVDPSTGRLRYGPVSHGSIIQRGDKILVISPASEPRGNPPVNRVWLFRYAEDAAASVNNQTAPADPPAMSDDAYNKRTKESAMRAKAQYPSLGDKEHPQRRQFEEWIEKNRAS